MVINFIFYYGVYYLQIQPDKAKSVSIYIFFLLKISFAKAEYENISVC